MLLSPKNSFNNQFHVDIWYCILNDAYYSRITFRLVEIPVLFFYSFTVLQLTQINMANAT